MAILLDGLDLFAVVNGTTSIDLRPLFPGSQIIRSDGIVLDRSRFGNATTGLRRLTTLPDSQSGVVQIEWILEHSKSVSPVDRSAFGLGSGEADFHTIINAGGMIADLPNTDGRVTPSLGSMAIRKTKGNDGGSFEFLLNINPLIVITTVGGSVIDLNGADVLQVIDGTGLLNPVSSVNGLWSTRSQNAAARPASAVPTEKFFVSTTPVDGYPSIAHLVSGGYTAARAVTAALF